MTKANIKKTNQDLNEALARPTWPNQYSNKMHHCKKEPLSNIRLGLRGRKDAQNVVLSFRREQTQHGLREHPGAKDTWRESRIREEGKRGGVRGGVVWGLTQGVGPTRGGSKGRWEGGGGGRRRMGAGGGERDFLQKNKQGFQLVSVNGQGSPSGMGERCLQ
jgi:hypothetical protein